MARLGFVVSEFNRDITYQMELLGKEHAQFLKAEVASVLYVPGVYDMPLAVRKLLRRDDIDAVVTIGTVIQGDTGHDEIVAQHAARKLMDLALSSISRLPSEFPARRCPGPMPISALITQKGQWRLRSSW